MLQKSGYGIVIRVLSTSQCSAVLSSQYIPLPSPPKPSTMVRHHISDELKEMALSMSLQSLHDSDIREYTGISERSLKRFRSTYRRRRLARDNQNCNRVL